MEQPRYSYMCKATTREDNEPRYSHNWVTARRARFKIYDDRIVCGDWTIPFAEVEQARVYETKSMFMSVEILHLITERGSFQFGFNPWVKAAEHLPLSLEREQVKMQYSSFSMMVRFVLVAYLAYFVVSKLL